MEGIEVNGKFFKITKHAAHRAAKRKITYEQISDAISNPKNIRKITRIPEKDSTFSYLGRNGVILIINYRQEIIITLMHRNKEYTSSKTRHKRNKRQLEFRRKYGNRFRE